MFRRVLGSSVAVVLPLVALLGARPATAAPVVAAPPASAPASALPQAAAAITNDDLAAAALTREDVPGFPVSTDVSPTAPGGVSAMFVRGFLSPDSGGAGVIDGLFVVDLPLPPSLLVSVISNAGLAQALGGAGANAQNFQTGPALGVGEADVQMAWDQTDEKSGLALHLSADLFARGSVIALVIYAAPMDAPQPALAEKYARLQDGKLVAAALTR